jgi:endonuclease YncB( thermonuclease family)
MARSARPGIWRFDLEIPGSLETRERPGMTVR